MTDRGKVDQVTIIDLFILESGLEYKPLNLNFEKFLGRYSRYIYWPMKEPFWDWRYTPEDDHRTR